MGCPSQTIVHAIEFIQIRALQHRFSGRLIRRVGNYLKPKVLPVVPSTRVTGLSEKNVVAYNSVSVRRISADRPNENAVLALAPVAPVAVAAAPI